METKEWMTVPVSEFEAMRAEIARLQAHQEATLKQLVAARQEVTTLRGAWREAEAECDQWSQKLAQAWAERQRLQGMIDTHNNEHRECPVIEAGAQG